MSKIKNMVRNTFLIIGMSVIRFLITVAFLLLVAIVLMLLASALNIDSVNFLHNYAVIIGGILWLLLLITIWRAKIKGYEKSTSFVVVMTILGIYSILQIFIQIFVIIALWINFFLSLLILSFVTWALNEIWKLFNFKMPDMYH